MSKSIKKKLLMIMDIASLDELLHKHKTKIKYLAKELLLDTDAKLQSTINTESDEKRIRLEFHHVYGQLAEVVNTITGMQDKGIYEEGFLVDEWYCLYDNYLELMSRVKGDISCHMVHKKHVPPYPEFKAWKKRKEEEEV